ncbi:aspartate/glutamate racemase family protein [[Actinomadura] parvosata]|uniref:aspartate/glutamate racemase family protein n=1 Tax=[Actinomadura] parvosata TaxID=1955412 RepID=UPI00406C4EB2
MTNIRSSFIMAVKRTDVPNGEGHMHDPERPAAPPDAGDHDTSEHGRPATPPAHERPATLSAHDQPAVLPPHGQSVVVPAHARAVTPPAHMRHLGILAHSTEGAALSFLSFCQEGFRRLGEHDHPDVTLDYIPFGRSMAAWDAGDHDTVRKTLAVSVRRLSRAGAEFFICPDNTAHLALERPGPALALPGLHIAEVVAEQAARDGRTRVGVLGTSYTMEGPVYPRALGARGIAAEIPDPGEREVINRIIFDELVNGVFTADSRAAYVKIIERLAARGCDAVALVCTEIPLLIAPEHSPLPTLDSTRLLSAAAFDAAVGLRPFPSWRGGAEGLAS